LRGQPSGFFIARSIWPRLTSERQMKRRNRKQELLKLAQLTKTYIDSLNLKDSDLVVTTIAAGILEKHEVTLRTWRSDRRGPPYSQERNGAAVLYRVGDLWNWCKRNIVDSAVRRPEQLNSCCSLTEHDCRNGYRHPNHLASNQHKPEDEHNAEVSK
jgi:hypothetical protein